jgi:hypothetical protein
MATIINNPPTTESSSNLVGLIIGLVVLTAVGWFFFAYAVPQLSQLRVGTPQVQVQVPDKIDVTINENK